MRRGGRSQAAAVTSLFYCFRGLKAATQLVYVWLPMQDDVMSAMVATSCLPCFLVNTRWVAASFRKQGATAAAEWSRGAAA